MCANHEYIVSAATAAANIVCATSEDCGAGEWESSPPKAGTCERECTPLTECSQGYEIAVVSLASEWGRALAYDAQMSLAAGCTQHADRTCSVHVSASQRDATEKIMLTRLMPLRLTPKVLH